jgi:hypothetical protein
VRTELVSGIPAQRQEWAPDEKRSRIRPFVRC